MTATANEKNNKTVDKDSSIGDNKWSGSSVDSVKKKYHRCTNIGQNKRYRNAIRVP
tara:strand:+ start:171 stop:338 length:168 start_codon:yes stop_codon:yes gene_type:complete